MILLNACYWCFDYGAPRQSAQMALLGSSCPVCCCCQSAAHTAGGVTGPGALGRSSTPPKAEYDLASSCAGRLVLLVAAVNARNGKGVLPSTCTCEPCCFAADKQSIPPIGHVEGICLGHFTGLECRHVRQCRRARLAPCVCCSCAGPG